MLTSLQVLLDTVEVVLSLSDKQISSHVSRPGTTLVWLCTTKLQRAKQKQSCFCDCFCQYVALFLT